jgi:hypothetical protein
MNSSFGLKQHLPLMLHYNKFILRILIDAP